MKKYTLKRLNPPVSGVEIDFAAELNPAQLEAVETLEGPVLIVAGAGSGKTRTLVHRVAKLVSQGVPPSAILLLTFTKKSAYDMLRRASLILDNRCQDVAGGTFHSFANIVLRRYGTLIGYADNFTILDRSDAEDLIQTLRKGRAPTTRRFPKKGTILSILSKSVNTQKSIDLILGRDYPQYANLGSEIRDIAADYTQAKRQMQVMDYDDLLVMLLELLEKHPQVCQELGNQYRYIMVDEYQDTNLTQAEIVYQLGKVHQNVMVVGDDAQSIYSFRGANFQNIMQFSQYFPGTRVVKLEENYRSEQPILDLTNAVIAGAMQKMEKHLYTDKKGGEKPVYIEMDRENTQSRFVCQKVLELREQGILLNRVAVLFRSGWQSNDLEIELQAHGIPFVKYGGFKFVEAAHVKDIIAALRIIHNPADQLSWQRVLLLLPGVGPKTASDLSKSLGRITADTVKVALAPVSKKAFYDPLLALVGLVNQAANPNPGEVTTQLIKWYRPHFETKYEDFNKRKTDLDSLIAIAERFTTLQSFLSDLSLDPPEASQIGAVAEPDNEEKLVLSTIHSAKGLEWHSVFILSLIDGFLPSFQSINDLGQIEEERRLLYVAMTRAEQGLFLLKPHIDSPMHRNPYGGMQLSQVSRFLTDHILQTFTEQWALTEDEDLSETTQTQDPHEKRYRF